MLEGKEIKRNNAVEVDKICLERIIVMESQRPTGHVTSFHVAVTVYSRKA